MGFQSLKKNVYMAGHFLSYVLMPRWVYRRRLHGLLEKLTDSERQMVEERVGYYCKAPLPSPQLGGSGPLPASPDWGRSCCAPELPSGRGDKRGAPELAVSSTTVGSFRFPYHEKRRFTFYFFDLYEVVRYFSPELHFNYVPGDVTEVPPQPAFVKSRPIGGDNGNAVLLKLNKRRHYGKMVTSDKPFSEKKDMLVYRSTWANNSPQRRRLLELYGNHPMFDVGKTRLEKDDDMPQCVKPELTIRQQLDYKFVACIEGVDVATSLKWVMSSNSIAVSPPMKYETWFMEGRLVAGYHYIEVKPDFSDLEEKMAYYISHPDEAEAIIRHAHEHVEQFRNKRMERIVQLAVAQRYLTPPGPPRGGISVVINTYNAEQHLRQVLDSVEGFDEVLVCDMESTDATCAIARQRGCRVVTFPKGNITIVEPARDFAIHQATHPWVLVVDADELVTPELRDYLYRHIAADHPADGIRLPRKNRLMGRFMHGYYPDYNLRFFRKDVTTWPPVIHAQPQVEGSVVSIPRHNKQLAINHLDDRTIRERLSKINLYTEHELEKRKDKHYGVMAFVYRPMVRFIKCYVLKGGFRDGVPGLLFAWLEAVQQFAILAKLYEKRKQQ